MSNVLTEHGCNPEDLIRVFVIAEYGAEYFVLKDGSPEEFKASNRKWFREGSDILMYRPHFEKPGKDKIYTAV